MVGGGRDAPLAPADARLHGDEERGVAEAHAEADEQRARIGPGEAAWRLEGDQRERAGDQGEAAERRRHAVRRPDHQPAPDDAAQRPRDGHDGEDEAGRARAPAEHALHVGRQEGGDAHHQRAEGEAAEIADGDEPIAPESERQHRLGGAPLVRTRIVSATAPTATSPMMVVASRLALCTSANIKAPPPSASRAEPR